MADVCVAYLNWIKRFQVQDSPRPVECRVQLNTGWALVVRRTAQGDVVSVSPVDPSLRVVHLVVLTVERWPGMARPESELSLWLPPLCVRPEFAGGGARLTRQAWRVACAGGGMELLLVRKDDGGPCYVRHALNTEAFVDLEAVDAAAAEAEFDRVVRGFAAAAHEVYARFCTPVEGRF